MKYLTWNHLNFISKFICYPAERGPGVLHHGLLRQVDRTRVSKASVVDRKHVVAQLD